MVEEATTETAAAPAATPEATQADTLYAAKPEAAATPEPTAVEPTPAKVEEATPEPAAAEPIPLTMPEGFTPDEAAMTEFTGLRKTLGLSNEQSQALLDMYAKQQTAAVTAWNETLTKWKTELDKDPAFAGEKREQALTVIGKAFDVYGSSEARAAFDETSAGWNPAIVRMMYKMASALDEGKAVTPGNPRPSGPRNPADLLYGGKAA